MMHDATMQGSPRKKFNKIRELNRRRNYFTKKVRNALRVGVAKALWDRRRRQPVDLSSAKLSYSCVMRGRSAMWWWIPRW